MYKSVRKKGSTTVQILVIMFLVLFLVSIMVNLSIYSLEKAKMKTMIIENSL